MEAQSRLGSVNRRKLIIKRASGLADSNSHRESEVSLRVDRPA
jgi:hypothetical protein